MAGTAALAITGVPQVAPVARVLSQPVQEVEASDEQLFAAAGAGDRQALGTLVRRYEKPLFGLLLRLTNGDRDQADDLFQETFLRAMRAAGTFKAQKQFKPWLTAIAVNLVRDQVRKKKVHCEVRLDGSGEEGQAPKLEPVSNGDTPAEAAARRDREQQVRQALSKLTNLEREVVLLHFYDGMTLQQAAEALRAPLGTIKSRLHAALTRLGQTLRGADAAQL